MFRAYSILYNELNDKERTTSLKLITTYRYITIMFKIRFHHSSSCYHFQLFLLSYNRCHHRLFHVLDPRLLFRKWENAARRSHCFSQQVNAPRSTVSHQVFAVRDCLQASTFCRAGVKGPQRSLINPN